MDANTETAAADLTCTRIEAGLYTIRVGGHAFFVAKDRKGSWGVEGLDNRSEDLLSGGIYHGTAYAAANELAGRLEGDRADGNFTTLKAVKAALAAIVVEPEPEPELEWRGCRDLIEVPGVHGSQVTTSGPFPYRAPVANGPEGNPAARGGCCFLDVRDDGARRLRNVNGNHTEVGAWTLDGIAA